MFFYKEFCIYFSGSSINPSSDLSSKIFQFEKDSTYKLHSNFEWKPYAEYYYEIRNSEYGYLLHKGPFGIYAGERAKLDNYKINLYFDYVEATQLLTKNDYKNAYTKLSSISKYAILDPAIYFNLGICEMNLGNTEKGCEDIKYAQVLAEQYGYPIIMEKEKVMDFLRKSCGEE